MKTLESENDEILILEQKPLSFMLSVFLSWCLVVRKVLCFLILLIIFMTGSQVNQELKKLMKFNKINSN